MINSYLWCPEQDSNLHASQHAHLKRADLDAFLRQHRIAPRK